jgi:hypothetical protein
MHVSGACYGSIVLSVCFDEWRALALLVLGACRQGVSDAPQGRKGVAALVLTGVWRCRNATSGGTCV